LLDKIWNTSKEHPVYAGAAGVTAAGASLYGLTNLYQNTFGGPADEPSSTELRPGY